MDKTATPTLRLPKIGMRCFKTALSATLCVLLYSLMDRDPTFACIGAVSGMGACMEDSWKTGGGRLIGTVVGGLLGIGCVFAYLRLPMLSPDSVLLSKSPFAFLGIILLINISLLLRASHAIGPGSVVFYIVLLNVSHEMYIIYALNRMLDTGVGIVTSMAINLALPRGAFSELRRKLADLFARLGFGARQTEQRDLALLVQTAEPEPPPG